MSAEQTLNVFSQQQIITVTRNDSTSELKWGDIVLIGGLDEHEDWNVTLTCCCKIGNDVFDGQTIQLLFYKTEPLIKITRVEVDYPNNFYGQAYISSYSSPINIGIEVYLDKDLSEVPSVGNSMIVKLNEDKTW